MPKLHLPAPLSKKIDKHILTVGEGTLLSCLTEVIESHPSLKPYLFNSDGEPTPYIRIFINNVDVKKLNGLETHVKSNDELQIAIAISGG